MDGGFSGPVNVAYSPQGTAGAQYVLRDGDKPGMRREEYNSYGRAVYELKKINSTVTAGDLLICDTTVADGSVVKDSAAATDIPVGVAMASGVSGQYIWMQIAGVAQVLCLAAVTVGKELSASATAATGQNAPFTAATVQGSFGVSLTAGATPPALTAVRLQGLQ